MLNHACLRWLLFFGVFTVVGVQAQNITKSPYSIIGVGDIIYTGNAHTYSLGMCNQAIRSPFSVNYLNPASYSAFITTNIEAGGTYSSANFSGAATSTQVTNAWISYFNFGIPLSLKRGMGVSFGAAPFSGVGYNIVSTTSIPQDTFTIPNVLYRYTGRGGLSKFYVGYGMRLLPWLSVGVNGNYVYGEVTNTTQLLIPAVYKMFNTNEDKTSFMNGWLIDYGFQMHDTLTRTKGLEKREYLWTVGGTITPTSTFKAEQQYMLRSLPIGSTTGTRDTILAQEQAKGTVTAPPTWRLGASYGRVDKWMVIADVRGTQWTQFKALGASDSLRNSLALGLGFSYIPDAKSKNTLARTEYRIGGRYEQSNLVLYGKGVDVYAITAGVGIPMGRTRSRLNLGIELMQRGTTEMGLVQENYLRAYIGITFADKWFYRYRYD